MGHGVASASGNGFRHCRARKMCLILRSICLLIALATVALHAPAALDTADGGAPFSVTAQAGAHHDGGALSLTGCHHARHHAHSLCAPPVIPVEQTKLGVQPGTGHVPPVKAVAMLGHVDGLSAPPPKSFV